MELVDYVRKGMPVIVVPGPRDREVNAQEGDDVPFVSSLPLYAHDECEIEEKKDTVKVSEPVSDTNIAEDVPIVESSPDTISSMENEAVADSISW